MFRTGRLVGALCGGDVVRVRLTNAHGTAPLVIGEARVALRVPEGAGNAPVTGISVGVRVEGTPDTGRLSFRIDDVGWTNTRDG